MKKEDVCVGVCVSVSELLTRGTSFHQNSLRKIQKQSDIIQLRSEYFLWTYLPQKPGDRKSGGFEEITTSHTNIQ